MSKANKTAPAYPDKTAGSRLAERVRKDANRLTEQKRAHLFDQGIQIIYGGSPAKKTVRTGH